MKLELNEIKKINFSIDEIGAIFYYGDKVLRAIKNTSKTNVMELLECGLIKELEEKKLFPRTIITDHEIDGFSIVLEHERIENWNYSYEWSFSMLKKVALVAVEINEIANKYGYELSDCHASNLIFNYGHPMYIDLGSFKKTNNTKVWSGKKIFYLSYYVPLKLSSLGFINSAKNITLSVEYFDKAEFLKMIYPSLHRKIILNFGSISNKVDSILSSSENKIKEKLGKRQKHYVLIALFIKKNFTFLSFNNKKAKKLITSLEPYEADTIWGAYHNQVNPKTSKRFNRVVEIINSFEGVSSVIEFAANQGKLSSYLLENSKIKSAIVTDYDRNAVETMYHANQNKKNFLPLLINFVKPEGRALDKKLEERLRADISISLAVTHHLLLTQNYDIEYILSTIKKFTKKYVLIEFMPEGLYGGDFSTTPKIPSHYHMKWFKENFMKYFDLILDEKVDFNRHLFVGKVRGLVQ